MTRINVVPPHTLTDQHLLAEYRELPRVFALARTWVSRGRPEVPKTYRLGAGHVRFFYPLTGWLEGRQLALIHECRARGFAITMTQPPSPVEGAGGWWTPDAQAVACNLQRLHEKVEARPGWYRWRGVTVPPCWYKGGATFRPVYNP